MAGQESTEPMAQRLQVAHVPVIRRSCPLWIDLLRHNLDCKIYVADVLNLEFQHAPEEHHRNHLAQEPRAPVDVVYAAQELRQRSLGGFPLRRPNGTSAASSGSKMPSTIKSDRALRPNFR
jgi:hypothetical protein